MKWAKFIINIVAVPVLIFVKEETWPMVTERLGMSQHKFKIG
jgi:hypothetical protein